MPRSKKSTPAEATAPQENYSETSKEEIDAMKAQVALQLSLIMKQAEKLGVSMKELYEVPPSDTNKIIEPKAVEVAPELGKPVEAAQADKPKPGTVLPGGNWVRWGKEDLNPNDTVEFVPLPIPGLVFPMMDENGYQKIRLDVNDLVCWLTCGIPNKVNRFFYNVYMNSYDEWRQLESFKRTGPLMAPWGQRGPDGGPAWSFTPAAPSFGMDDDGRSLRRGGPTPLDPRPITPPAAAEPVSTGTPPEGTGA